MNIETEVSLQLRELRWILRAWIFGLVSLAIAMAVLIFWPVSHFGLTEIAKKIATDPVLAAIAGASLAAIVAFFGHLLSNFSVFIKQYVETAKTIRDELRLRRKRLVAFNAEIHENQKTVINYFSKERRTELIAKLEANPAHLFFTKSDTTNPIFEDNREHLHSFSNETIRGIINYYNSEANLNISIATLATPEFKSLEISQRVNWIANLLFSCNDVYRNAEDAMNAIKSEIHSLRESNDDPLTLIEIGNQLDGHQTGILADQKIPKWIEVTYPAGADDKKAELFPLLRIVQNSNKNSVLPPKGHKKTKPTVK